MTVMIKTASYQNTRGNRYKLFPEHVHNRFRRNFLTNRIIDIWNSLPDYVVACSTINSFKNNLDNFWKYQEFRFNWKADIAGIGNRSYNVV